MAIDATVSAANSTITACTAIACFLGLFGCSSQSGHTFYNDKVPAKSEGIIRISAVGDIMLGGTAEPVLQQQGYDYPFENLKFLFTDSDIVIGNLEGPLTHSENSQEDDKEYVFKTPPEKVAPALKNAGFTLMNLANNHIMDFGLEGLRDTRRALERQGIRTVGVGDNLAQARQGTLIQTKNGKIGFLSYSLTFPESYWADENRAGTAFGHEHQIRQDVQRMKQRADLVVVSYHWGQEKSAELREYQPVLARAAVDEGASLVIGHHPHVLQAVEKYKHGVILYSLGNFTFGSYSRAADTSLVASVDFRDLQFHRLRLIPINVLNIEVNFQPRLLTGENASRAFSHLSHLSKQQNTRLNFDKGVAFLHNTTNMSHSMTIMH